ncbi:MAG TPA: RNA polymerase subunit sigma-70 [Planctomycetes bacterium]|nr:RNA polymerase subunit sigma-70 [Planctomycetota bacterium]
MSADSPSTRADQTTRLMNRFSAGEEGVSEELMELIFSELHELASAQMRGERPDHTLQPTALVGEAYMRLVAYRDASWESRKHFYGMAAKVMRSLLVDHAREKRAAKRGGGRARVPLEEGALGRELDGFEIDMIDLDNALAELAAVDENLARAVELRYFGGLSVNETAAAMEQSVRTTERRLRAANAWLRDALGGGGG